MDRILYGCAYYDEYMPLERLENDMEMMRRAGINVIRIAESTWATEEPQEGVFDFSHVTRTIEAAARHGISVIVGTPTYAIPPWLAARYPDVIALTEQGQGKYGPRQNMDITHPRYLFYAERVIRRLMEAVAPYENVIGFQLDNETKHYHVAGPRVQQRFFDHLRETFGTVEAMNQAFGFAYWSNAVDTWEHLPDVTGTINGSYLAAFEAFRRQLVTDFLLWQRSIVDAYRRPDQFVTHNFDFAWHGYSFGVQPDVDHARAAQALTIAGCDIYHPTQDDLTGREIAFCGSLTRCLKQQNYLVLETEAQGFPEWTPYDGQLRLQAFSHLSSGADSVMYWHWHSLHNGCETYWKGLLSHDLKENRLYREAQSIGRDLQRIGNRLVHLRKENRVAILVSNEALTSMGPWPLFALPGNRQDYNDVVRAYADALFEMNVEYDVVFPETATFSDYDLLIVPALYSASDELLQRLRDYAARGGVLLAAIKCGFTDEHVKVRHETQPAQLHECFGVTYQEFTVPKTAGLRATSAFPEAGHLHSENSLHTWMELLMPHDATVLAEYVHPCWGQYAAVTEKKYGRGCAIYAGCLMSHVWTRALCEHALALARIEIPYPDMYPISIKSGINAYGQTIRYYLNYSSDTRTFVHDDTDGLELLSGQTIACGEYLTLQPWAVAIVAYD